MPVLTSPALPLAHATAGGDAERWWELAGVLVLAGLAAAYGRGVQELWRRGGRGSAVRAARAAAFAGGIAAVVVAQSPPVHRFAEDSFTGHMSQHMILLVVAGPLLAAGAAGLPLSLALPRRARLSWSRLRAGAVGRWLRGPLHRGIVVGTFQVAVLWFWHLPAPYLSALEHPAVHAAEHASFVLAAWLLWSAVLAPGRHRLAGPAAFLLLFATGMAAAALGAVLTLAPAPLYPAGVLAEGDPLADQQRAGLAMWIPMDVVDGVLALALFAGWLSRQERRTPGDRDLAPPPAEEVTG
ncbi:cytochrome c oxidase assembly protein [Amycolatopsis cynarae]|uniref:Cytochrome c oxidase assembly protein n=1 Tax=Amycolatopsis cynarae TaxID=2995223 RepID=A0ABY7BEA2_9PSEU|nr:cytochrome c oxidase assembly protein [Amycolatopsis sp. HUAS 11-8]WAL69562.1 cytochrome c oxidase assembly protein [Amycolatopsis sp. HUAS 11-8]